MVSSLVVFLRGELGLSSKTAPESSSEKLKMLLVGK